MKTLRIVGKCVFALVIGTIVWSFMGNETPSELVWANAIAIVGFFGFYTVKQGLVFYVGRRILQTIAVLWLISTLTFSLLRVIPGGPFDQEKVLAPEVKAAIEAKYNLNDTVLQQYGTYLWKVIQGDFGQSYKYVGRSVTEILSESFPVSFQLGIFSLVVAFVVGIPSGVYAASKHNTWRDNFTMIGAISMVSLPSFLAAAIGIMVFCFWWDLLPVALWDGTANYILPVVILGVRPAAIIARLTRASVLEVIRSDFIRTARAKGLEERVILFKHVLKNSLIPVLTFAGPLAAGILSGAFIIEHIFGIPGMGKHFIQSVTNRDYPLVLGVTLIFSFMLVISNLVVDILYTYFDPRIKLS